MMTLVASLIVLSPSEASAQTATNSTAGNQWGTYSSGLGVAGAVDSAVAHVQDGTSAGQVNAALLGMLFGNGTSNSIQAIGSQTIINNSIAGNNITSSIQATQTSSNSGAVKNGGLIGQTLSGNSTN